MPEALAPPTLSPSAAEGGGSIAGAALGLEPERELLQRQSSLGGKAAGPQPFEVRRIGVLCTADDAQVLATTHLRRRLHREPDAHEKSSGRAP